MNLRLTPLTLLLVALPLVLLGVGLAIHPSLWVDGGTRHIRAAVMYLLVTGIALIGWLASYSDVVRERLSVSGWHRARYVRSSPAQAAVAVQLMRWGSVALLWAMAILGVLGRGGR